MSIHTTNSRTLSKESSWQQGVGWSRKGLRTWLEQCTGLQATANTGRYTQNFTYNCVSPYAKARIGANVTAAPCVAPTSYNQGSALAVYNSTTFYDDLVWAASWMYYATGTPPPPPPRCTAP
jgi:hypothetical protein